jgi:K+ transporter
VLALVLGFQSSSNLDAAYGIAVTGTMAIDTVLAFVVVRNLWGWNWGVTAAGIVAFLTIDLAFLGANALKFFQGGWFPVLVAIAVFTLLATWKRGRALLYERLKELAIAIEPFLDSVARHPPARVPGTAAFLTTKFEGVPHALMHNLKHNKVLHERVGGNSVSLTLVANACMKATRSAIAASMSQGHGAPGLGEPNLAGCNRLTASIIGSYSQRNSTSLRVLTLNSRGLRKATGWRALRLPPIS